MRIGRIRREANPGPGSTGATPVRVLMFYTGHMASSPLSRVRNLEHPHRFEGLPENGKLLRTAALLGAVLLASAAASAEEWTFEVVDGTRVGTVSLVMENSGQRHISYYDSSFETRLKYAFHDGKYL